MTCIARELSTFLSSYLQFLDMFQSASNFNNSRERCTKRQCRGPFRFGSSTCGKESNRTFGLARSNQLAVELVEVLPETSASGNHHAVVQEGGSLSDGRHDTVVVVEL